MQYKSPQRDKDGLGQWVKLTGYFTRESFAYVLCETESQQWITLLNLPTCIMYKEQLLCNKRGFKIQILILAFWCMSLVIFTVYFNQ